MYTFTFKLLAKFIFLLLHYEYGLLFDRLFVDARECWLRLLPSITNIINDQVSDKILTEREKKKHRTKVQTVAIILVCDFFLGSATFCAPNLNSIQLVVQYDARLFLYAHIAWRTHEWNQSRWLLWRRDKVWWINLLHAVLLCLLVYLLTIVAGSSLQYHYALRLFFIRTALCFYKQMSIP